MSLPPDPRVDGDPEYNREEIITAVTEFYKSLARLPYIELADILIPPPDGWPHITEEKFAALRKNHEVIELIRHLPYMNMSRHEYMIAPDTYPIDYRGKGFNEGEVSEESAGRAIPPGLEVPEWVVPLTYGSRDGTYLMLDTTDGTITEYTVVSSSYDPDYEPDDPRSWRDQCQDSTTRLTDFLGEWKRKYESLEWIGFPMNNWPNVWWADEDADEDDEEVQQLKAIQQIIRDHGWPNSFRREECKQALIEWEKSQEENY